MKGEICNMPFTVYRRFFPPGGARPPNCRTEPSSQSPENPGVLLQKDQCEESPGIYFRFFLITS